MKRKLLLYLTIIYFAAVMMTACGKKDDGVQDVQQAEQTEEPAASYEETQPALSISEDNTAVDVEEPEIDAVYVKSAEEFLVAIAPDTTIVLEPGNYNLSNVIRNAHTVEENMYLERSFASVDDELIVQEVNNLKIKGPEDGKAEIVVEDPYAAVMAFVGCSDITLSNVTMGHAVEKGYCSGSVIRIDGCDNITIENDDLYGCGTYGLECYRSQGVRVNDTTIRECTYGITSIYLSSDMEFNNCVLKECEHLDLIDARMSSIKFNNCQFKDNKTNYDFIMKDSKSSVIFKGCSFGELETERINEMNGGCGTCIFENCTFAGNNLKPVVTVSNAKELLDAIRPGATIYMEPGIYNLSETAQQIYDERGNVWNRTHDYVKFEEVFDGVEIVLDGVENLTIYGLGESREDVSLLVNPRYAAVFKLSYCKNITMMNLTAGHTDRGTCVGNVIDISGGSGFIFNNVDLFGCGVNGIGAYDSCEGIYIYDSIVHDCEYGPFEIESAIGNIYVVNTELSGSNGGGYYGPGGYFLYFVKCFFGEKESNTLYYMDTAERDIQIISCSFSEITAYPDYEPDWEEWYVYEPDGGDNDYSYVPEFNRDALKVVPFDACTIEDSMYRGYSMTDNNSGDVTSFVGEEAEPTDYVKIYFYIDGSAYIYGIDDVEGAYIWNVDSSYTGTLTSADGSRMAKLSLYSDTSEGESDVWMLLSFENKTIWLY